VAKGEQSIANQDKSGWVFTLQSRKLVLQVSKKWVLLGGWQIEREWGNGKQGAGLM
jgi:hypothetical protein